MPWWRKKIKSVVLALAVLTCLMVENQLSGALYAQNFAPLATGDWYKIAVTEDGIYKLDIPYLRALGININQLSSTRIALYGNGSGVLSQENNLPRPDRLKENAIWVDTTSTGELEAIYFYGQGPTTISYDPASNQYAHEINPYTDTTYYFLTITDAPARRIATHEPTSPQSPVISNTFEYYWFYEKESVNLLKSGREWWGDYLGTTPSRNFELALPGLVTPAQSMLTFRAIATAQKPTTFKWEVENQPVGEQTAGTVSNQRYDLKAQKVEASFNFTLPTNLPDKLKMSVAFDKTDQPGATAYLDYVSLQLKRRLIPYDTPTIYRFPAVSTPDHVYEFERLTDAFLLWDITDPLRPVNIRLKKVDNDKYWLFNSRIEASTYIGFSKSQALMPASGRKIANQNIRSAPTPELLIVTAGEWLDAAERLAAFRETHDGLNVLIVTIEQVYNEFSSGKQDVTAIRDLCRYFYLKDESRLKYLLLFGDATYDFRNKGGTYHGAQQQAWIPSYQSRESLHPVYTFSSDDYFGFLEEGAGRWEENERGDHRLQIGVGRLPVKNLKEANLVVNKLIDYSSESVMGKWRNRITFVADNGDNNIHQLHADLLAKQVAGTFEAARVFVDEYPLVATPLGNRAPAVKHLIKRKINEGSLIVNFTGHGDESGWTDEQILTLSDIQTLRGYQHMPLLVTATCEFGRYDDPSVVSGAELMLLSPRGAAIGAMTTTRPVFASTNFTINTAFYQALTSGGRRLGDLFRKTKNNSLSGSLNRNFVLLGDPSMTLAIPELGIRWASPPDTLSPFEEVTLRAEIFDPATNSLVRDFTGVVHLTVFDEPARFETLGAISQPASYEELRTKLFEGSATVVDGQFEWRFIVPHLGVTTRRTGTVSVYAHSDETHLDASGHLDIPLTPPTVLPVEDKLPPAVEAYLNDRSFADGQTIGSSPILIAHLSDASGFILSDPMGSCGMTATLNDTLILPIQDYYSSDRDTYTKATVRMPLYDLEEGSHALYLRFCDIFGNKTEKTIRFKVKRSSSISVSSSIVFPNPFRDKITFRFEHDKPGSDIEVQLKLFSVSGRLIYTDHHTFYNAAPVVERSLDDLFFLNGIKPPPQIYLYELTLRSLQDMSTKRLTGRLLQHK